MSEAIPTRIVCPSCNISIFTRVNRDGAVEALLLAAKAVDQHLELKGYRRPDEPRMSLRAAIAQVEGNS